MSKVWFITGASRGFGLEFAKAALERGDQVAATARNTAALDELVSAHGGAVLPLQLDVTDRDAAFAAVQQAQEKFGRLDVVVNNAGYGLFGAVEEITDAQLRDQLDVNLFGVLHVTQAVLPVLREQGSGHIIQISTIGGVAAFPNLGGYHASKWALEGMTESLAQEVAGFGIKITLVEPGGYATDWAGSSATHATPQPQYDSLRNTIAEQQKQSMNRPGVIGDPVAAGPAILKLADADQPPLRVFFGTFPTMIIRGIYEKRLATWDEWKPLSVEANGTLGS
jgi:NAD(P)-dependent dehydrogenase (short-subunit alcohol dehydrogenase family)